MIRAMSRRTEGGKVGFKTDREQFEVETSASREFQSEYMDIFWVWIELNLLHDCHLEK